MTEPENLPTPTRSFAYLARRLLEEKRGVMERKDCTPQEALNEARMGMVWDFRLDALAKGTIMGIGTGGLVVGGLAASSALVPAFAAATLCAILGYKAANASIERAHEVDRAFRLYNKMSPAAFNQYLSRANQPA